MSSFLLSDESLTELNGITGLYKLNEIYFHEYLL